MRGDNAREAAGRFVTEDDELEGRIVIGGVEVDVTETGFAVTALVRQLRRAVEELIREREAEAARAATARAQAAEWSRWRAADDDDYYADEYQ